MFVVKNNHLNYCTDIDLDGYPVIGESRERRFAAQMLVRDAALLVVRMCRVLEPKQGWHVVKLVPKKEIK